MESSAIHIVEHVQSGKLFTPRSIYRKFINKLVHPTPPEHGYPAIEALAQQGESARTPLLDYIDVMVDSLSATNAIYALVGIKTLDPAISILQLKEGRQSAQSYVASRFNDATTFANTIWPRKKDPLV
jgi:hypothetical protein